MRSLRSFVKDRTSVPPRGERRLFPGSDRLVPTPVQHRWGQVKDELKYHYFVHTKPANPFTLLEIDPNSITHVTVGTDAVDNVNNGISHPQYTHDRTANTGRFKWSSAGEIKDGEWDRRVIPIEEFIPYCSLRERYVDEVPWEATEYYQAVVDCLQNGSSLWGCSTEEEFRRYRCTYIDSLYRSIDREGYKSQVELNDDPTWFDAHREVEVNVGRDGHLLFNDGKHRLSIAKILGVDRIPVRIMVRHDEYVERTDERGLDKLATDSDT